MENHRKRVVFDVEQLRSKVEEVDVDPALADLHRVSVDTRHALTVLLCTLPMPVS